MSHLVTFVFLCLLPQTTTTRTEETLPSETKGFNIIEITKDKVPALEDVPLSDVDAMSVHGNAVLKSLIESNESYCIALRDRGVPVFLYAENPGDAEKTAKESGLFGPTQAGSTEKDYIAFKERPWAVVPSVANAKSLEAFKLMAKSPFPLGIVVHGEGLWRGILAADDAWRSLQLITEAGVPLLIFTSSEQNMTKEVVDEQLEEVVDEQLAAQGNVFPSYAVTFQYEKYAEFCSATASEWILQPVVARDNGEYWDFGPDFWKINDVALREDVKTHFGGVQKPHAPEFFLHGSNKDPRTFCSQEAQLWTVAVVDSNQELYWPTKSAVTYQMSQMKDPSGYQFGLSYAVKKPKLEELCKKVIGFVSVWRRTKGCSFAESEFGPTLSIEDMESQTPKAYARINYGLTRKATNAMWPDAYVFTAGALKECGIHLQHVYKLRAPCPTELGQPSGRA